MKLLLLPELWFLELKGSRISFQYYFFIPCSLVFGHETAALWVLTDGISQLLSVKPPGQKLTLHQSPHLHLGAPRGHLGER